jgi:hypothetical protein
VDYKARHPDLNDWPHFHKLEVLQPWPLKMRGCEVYESLVHAYLVEAPRVCPKRLSFEIGEISGRDFWYSQLWIIRVDFSLFGESYSHAKYIEPIQFCESFKRILNYEKEPCLFDQQLAALENGLERLSGKPNAYAKLLREYQEFCRLYEARMGRRAA